jgi:long-chain acyl-CoA synthetase
VNLFERLELVAGAQPDRLALQIKEEEDYRRLTYGDVARQARSLAAAFVRAGLVPGDRVALVSENRPEWAVAYFAVVAAGGTVVPLDVQLGDAEVANVLRHAGCRLAVASGKQAGRLLALGAHDAVLSTVADLDAETHGDRVVSFLATLTDPTLDIMALPGVEADALASILYTSGTTGLPKGVMLSHGNFLANAESVMRFRLINAQDNLLSVLPLHHAFPFMVQLILLFTGARITFSPSLKGPDLLACMQETGVTALVAVPQLFYLLHKGIFDQIGRRPALVRLLLRLLLRLSGALRPTGINLGRLVFGQVHRRFGGRIRIMASGGARLDPIIARDFLALGFTLTEGYGLTETAPVVAFNPLERIRPGSVGVPLPGVEVRIDRPDKDGVGEIAIRGPNVMRGYYRHPEATAEVMRDGWFLSGDLGYLTPDGYVVITGRAKEVIVLSSGKNIYPEEIEEQYLKSVYIQEICLVPQASDRGGATVEGLLALVLPDLDLFRAKGLTNVAETIRWDMENVGKDLPAYKRPTGLRIVKEGFPRTRLGKIQRHLVQQQLREARAGDARPVDAVAQAETERAAQEDEVACQVLAYLREASERPVVRLDDNLELDLGLDSLARVEMLAALESALHLTIADEAAAELYTVREVIEHLRALRAGGPIAKPATRRRGWTEILSEEPPAEVAQLVEMSSGPSAARITAFSRAVCIAVLRGIYRLRVEGLEHVPASGPLILVANHCSYFDAFILATALPYPIAQQVFYLGFETFFRTRILAWWARGARVIPVDMDNFLVRALQASARILRDGKILCLFPEGERSADGSVRAFRKGTGILVRELRVPVLPAHITGSFEAWPRGQAWPRLHSICVRFGPVVSAADLLDGDGPRRADDPETVVLRLRERVIALGQPGGAGGTSG